MQELLRKASQIKLVIFDVDGVLTDGRLYLTESGEEIKAFHSRDGHGMKMLRESGVEIAIITGRKSKIVSHRMKELGIQHVYQGQNDKLAAYKKIVAGLRLEAKHVAYVGDDLIDLPVMCQVGLAIAVQDANDFVKRYAHWQTPNAGGRGAARDVCELILEGLGVRDRIFSSYLS